MKFAFFKYQGTGNDFIIIDNRDLRFPIDEQLIVHICDRKFGIGSDGLILIQQSEKEDFHMEFFNPDASQSFCGNGSRCAVSFAYKIGIISNATTFSAIDGVHSAKVETGGLIEVSMKNVDAITSIGSNLVLNTGSPHYVRFTDDLSKEDIFKVGQKIRYSPEFNEEGINVNLVELLADNSLQCATYERGVENETLSCGTGVTAMAIAANKLKNIEPPITVITKGGELEVGFEIKEDVYQEVYLKGPATFVYKGEINL